MTTHISKTMKLVKRIMLLCIIILVSSFTILFSTRSYAQVKLGDNLGLHSATQDLDMNNFDITNAKNINSKAVMIGSVTSLGNNIALRIEAINSTILITRVPDLLNATAPSIPASSAVNGMIVYNNATNLFYFRQNGAWKVFASTYLPAGNIYLGNSSGNLSNSAVGGHVRITSEGASSLVDGAVKTSHILDGNVSSQKISLSTLENRNFKTLSVTNAKLAAKSVAAANFLPGTPGTVLGTVADGTVKWTSSGTLGFVVGDIKPFFSSLGIPVPDGWLPCNGQVVNDPASPLNGKVLPNLNNSSYMVGGLLADNGSVVGANTKSIAVNNLPVINLTGTSSAVSAGNITGAVTVAYGGTHQHLFQEYYFSIPGQAFNNSGASDGDYMGNSNTETRTSYVSPDLSHNHGATFSGQAMTGHSHTAIFPLNDNQIGIDLRPKSIVTTWLIRVK